MSPPSTATHSPGSLTSSPPGSILRAEGWYPPHPADLETCDLRGMQGNTESHFQLHPPSATARQPGDQGPSLLPRGAAGPARCGPSGGSWLQSCLLSPRTIVGKSRTTGSLYLTSVSSTIAKNSGRQAAVADPDLERPRPVLRKRQGWLAWSRMVQAGGILPRQGKVTLASCWLPWCGSPAPT